MTGFRPLFWPTVFSVPVLLLLLGLGSWQIERLFWKRELIAQRQAALAAAPVTAPRSLEEARGLEFRHVTDEGLFLHNKEIFLGATSEAGRNGYQVLTPLQEPAAASSSSIAGSSRQSLRIRQSGPPVKSPARSWCKDCCGSRRSKSLPGFCRTTVPT